MSSAEVKPCGYIRKEAQETGPLQSHQGGTKQGSRILKTNSPPLSLLVVATYAPFEIS